MKQIRFGDWQAVIEPACGSNVTDLQYRGKSILRAPDSVDQLKGRPCLYGVPLLLPANRTADGMFAFEEKTFRLPINEPALNNHIHGLLKDAPFRLVECSDRHVVTALENRGAYYPFPFCLEIVDSLGEDGFTRRMFLKNIGAAPMPYTLALHTAFLEPESFCVPIEQCYEMDARHIPTGMLLPLSTRQQAYREGMRPDGSSISGVYTSCGNTVRIGDFRMTVSEQFDHWVLFNSTGGEGFLCIEPQCGGVNGLNSGKHRVLAHGAQEEFVIQLSK